MSTEQKLEEILDVNIPTPQTPTISGFTQEVMIVEQPDLSNHANNTVAEDASQARTNIRTSICQLQTAVNEALAIARASGKPRAYEVAANMLKMLADLQHDLMTVHAEERDLSIDTSTPVSDGDVNIEQAVFVGSTTDLAELIKQKRAKRNANNIPITEKTIEARLVQTTTGQPEILSQES